MNLKEKVIKGLQWSVVSKLTVQVFSWVSTFLVLRFLVPEDYAVMALVTIITSFISLFAINGFSAVIVKNRVKSLLLERQVFTLSLLIYLGYSLLLLITSESIADFFGSAILEDVLFFYVFALPLNSLLIIPTARFDIAMNFKSRAIVDGISAFISSVVCLTLAYKGFGVWALVMGDLSMLASRVILYLYLVRVIPSISLDFSSARNWFGFLFHLQINSILWYSYNKLDSLLIGRLIGMRELGIYNVGVQVASIPATKLSSIINQVGFSAFSTVNHDIELANNYLRKSVRLAAFILFPIFHGIASVSDNLVNVLMGEKWKDSAVIISVFCFIFPLRMINTIFQNFLNSLGMSKENVINTAITFFLVTLLIILGSNFGVLGVAIGWLFGYSCSFAIILTRLSSITSTSLKSWLFWLPFLFNSLIMFALINIASHYISLDFQPVFHLLMQIFLGVLYIFLSYLIVFRNDVSVLKSLKSK